MYHSLYSYIYPKCPNHIITLVTLNLSKRDIFIFMLRETCLHINSKVLNALRTCSFKAFNANLKFPVFTNLTPNVFVVYKSFKICAIQINTF